MSGVPFARGILAAVFLFIALTAVHQVQKDWGWSLNRLFLGYVQIAFPNFQEEETEKAFCKTELQFNSYEKFSGQTSVVSENAFLSSTSLFSEPQPEVMTAPYLSFSKCYEHYIGQKDFICNPFIALYLHKLKVTASIKLIHL